MGNRKQNTMVCATQKRIKNLLTDCGCPDCHDCKDIVKLNTFENLAWNFDRLFESRSNINCPCICCRNNKDFCRKSKKHNKNRGCEKPKRKCKKCPNCVYCPPCKNKSCRSCKY